MLALRRETPAARLDRATFPTKGEAVRAFIAANMGQCETWGLDRPATGGEFDAVNERYELRGRMRVRTLGQAIAACIPREGRSYSLASMDLDTLNDTGPARDAPFALPEAAACARLEARAFEFGPDPYDIPESDGTVMFDTKAFARREQRRLRKDHGDAEFRALIWRLNRDWR